MPYKLTNKEKVVLLAFAENDMVVSRTAEAMRVHRNTTEYHLKRVYWKTGKDPRKFFDLADLLGYEKKGQN